MPPFRFHQCRRQIDLQLKFPLFALVGIRQFGSQPHPFSQVRYRFDKTRFHGGLLTGPQPVRKHAVRGVLYQGMLEEERGVRLRPRCKNEPAVDEASHCLVQFRLGSLSDHRQQLV